MPEKSITAFAEFREELRTAITFWIIGASIGIGQHLVAHYKLVAVRKWATKEQALADHYWGPHGKQRD